MPHPWEAERSVDPALAQKLIQEQMPAITAVRIELLGEGWDNIVYRVDNDWVFRFPRRQMGADILEVEYRVLPRVADKLPLPVSAPLYHGKPTADFPWPFAGYRFLPGRSACRAALTNAQRHAAAAPLGRFLAALHAIPGAALQGTEVPGDRLGRMDPEKRIPQTCRQLQELVDQRIIAAPEPWLPLLRDLPRGNRPACLVHGDLYSCHLLVDEDGLLCGVIDWGDIHWGDPATDLMIVFTLLPAAARAAFYAAYGLLDPDTRRLARFRALNHTTTLLRYAHATGDAALLHESLQALHFLAEAEEGEQG
ncbi:MAG TPA: phosphotransferase [Armatimonadota bacterium]|nr:phosphotransferase [Armatimonadota bacterium]